MLKSLFILLLLGLPLAAGACVSVARARVEPAGDVLTYDAFLLNRCRAPQHVFAIVTLYDAAGTALGRLTPVEHAVRGGGLTRVAGRIPVSEEMLEAARVYRLRLEQPL